MTKKSITVFETPHLTTSTDFFAANNYQNDAGIWMGNYEKTFYFCKYSDTPAPTDYDNWVCSIADGEIQKLFCLGRENDEYRIVGQTGTFLYYLKVGDTKNSMDLLDSLFCYDLQTSENHQIYLDTSCFFIKNSHFFSEDGTLCIAFLECGAGVYRPQYLYVQEAAVLGTRIQSPSISLGGAAYRIEREDSTYGKVICMGDLGEYDIQLGDAQYRSIVFCNDSLIVHNENGSELLYRITESGEVESLFSVPCLSSISAMNICNGDVYISFMRFEKFQESGLLSNKTKVRFKNDTLEGTYRIRLEDGSAEKISNRIFTGMYNLDDTGLYCCDEDSCIYKLDLTGNEVAILDFFGKK